MRNAFSQAIVAAAVTDPRVLVLTGDHGYALFDEFRSARPRQFINCGVAEQNMVGVAAGLAKAGYRPIVYGLAAFVPVRVLEQIKIDICYEGLPVVLVGDGAGLVYGHLGTTHQSTEDIALTRALPGLAVLSPADRFEMRAAMDLALGMGTPVYLRMGKSDRGDVHSAAVTFKAGEALNLRRGSARIALVATGSMVRTALELADGGLDVDVWSAPSLKPFAESALREITGRADRIVTLEEHSTIGGLGDCVAEVLGRQRPLPHLRIGVADRYSQFCGSWAYLIEEHGLATAAVARRVREFLSQGPLDTDSWQPEDTGKAIRQ